MRNLLVSFTALLSIITLCERSTFAEPNQPAEKPAKAEAATGKKPKPEDVLRKMADYLGNLPAFSSHIDSTLEIKATGMDNKMTTKMAVRMQKPNRIAMLLEEGQMGMTIVSDGKTLTQYMPALKRYTVGDAPADLADFGKSDEPNPIAMMGAPPLPTSGDEFYKGLMSGVTKSEYLGIEKVGDVECHHLRFSQEQFDWDIWISTGDKPLIQKVVPDFGKRFAGAGGALKDAKMSYIVHINDWNTAPKFTDADFKFTPPADAEKVDSLFEGMGGQEEEGPHPLLGQPAPAFQTVDVDDHPIDLKNYLGKNVILLDFWATWCGPCVQAMPKVDAVAKKFADKGLVFKAVNCGEDAKTIKEFLESSKLDPPVVLDMKNEIGPLYKVTGIPQTVLIGKDGKVQVVHVGFSENLGEVLTKEIEDLLAGKDLAGPELKKAEEARKKRAAHKEQAEPDKKQGEPIGVTPAWSVPGKWSGVGTHAGTNTVYAIGSRSDAAIIDAKGNIQKKIAIERGGVLRLANLAGDDAPELLVFQGWGQDVKAYDANGKELWDYSGGAGVDDVWAADLTGDGMDEIIVGYNGGSGLHVLDQLGKPVWKFGEIGNVWHVTSGDFNNDGRPEVVTTSAVGKLHVFDTAGQKIKDISVPIYATMVRMAKVGNETLAIVGGSGAKRETLTAVNFEGQEKWTLELSQKDGDNVDDLAIAATKPWAAVAMRGGLIQVVDLESGRVIARAPDQGKLPHATWLPRPEKSPLLVVATGKDLNAFEITPTNAEEPAK